MSEELRQSFEQLGEHLGYGFDVAMLFIGLWGLLLWLFGRRIVRPSLAMIGLIAGAATAGLLARGMSLERMILLVVGGGIAGGLIFYASYRLWVAVLLALVLAIAAPWTVLAWQGGLMPRAEEPFRERAQQMVDEGLQAIADGVAERAGAEIRGEPEPTASADEGERAGEPTALDRLAEAGREIIAEVQRWWEEDLSETLRYSMISAAGLMAVTGLILGLIAPNLGASLVAALVGAALMLSAAARVTLRYVSDLGDWLPQDPRTLAIVLITMTTVGALVQWTILRPRADK
jgi:hypothetical protein